MSQLIPHNVIEGNPPNFDAGAEAVKNASAVIHGARPPCQHAARTAAPTVIPSPRPDTDPRTVIANALTSYASRNGSKMDGKFINDISTSCFCELIDYLTDRKHERDDDTKARAFESMQDVLILHAEKSQYWEGVGGKPARQTVETTRERYGGTDPESQFSAEERRGDHGYMGHDGALA